MSALAVVLVILGVFTVGCLLEHLGVYAEEPDR